MPETILVRHPAPVRHVPKASRNERLAFARIETPAILHEADPDAFAALTGPDGHEIRTSLRLRDGKLWTPLCLSDGEALAPVKAEAFRAFLRGDDEGGAGGIAAFAAKGLTARFRQSHLVAVHAVAASQDSFETRLATGVPIDVEASRSVAHDGRESCARAMAAWLADDVAVVGAEVWVRSRPLVRYRHDGQRHDLTLMTAPLSVPGAIPHLGFGSIDAGVAAYRNSWDRAPDRSHHLVNVLSALPAGYGGDDDLAYLANHLVDEVFRIPALRSFTEGVVEEIAEIKAKLLPARYAAMTGRIDPAEAPDILRLVRQAAGVVARHAFGRSAPWGLVNGLAYLDAAVIPRIDAVPDVDADDMAGLVR